MRKSIILLIAFMPTFLFCRTFGIKQINQSKNITLESKNAVSLKKVQVKTKNGIGKTRDQNEFLKYFDFANGQTIWSDDPLYETVKFTPSQYPCIVDSIMLVAYIDRGVPSIPDTVFIRDDDSGTSAPGTILNSFTFFCSGGNGTIDTVIVNTNGLDTIFSGDFWIEYRTVSEGRNSILLLSDKNTPSDNINYWSTDRQTWNSDNVNEPLATYVTYSENGQISLDRDTVKIVYPIAKNNRSGLRTALDSVCYNSIETDNYASYFTNTNLYSSVRFTLPMYPSTIESTRVYFYATASGNFEDTLFLWSDNSGNPGDLLAKVVWNYNFPTSGIFGLNIPLNHTFYSGDYWLGSVSVENASGDSLLLCTDTTTGDNSGRNYYSWNRQSWTQLSNSYGDWGITSFYRYTNTDSGTFYIINPSGATENLYVSDIFAYNNSSWILDISPTSLTIPPGDSAPVYINVDTFNLSFGNYIDSLEIVSNASKLRNSIFIPIILDYNSGLHAGITTSRKIPTIYDIVQNKISDGKLYLSKSLSSYKNISASVFDLSGKKVYTVKSFKSGYVNLNRLGNGIYFIRLNVNGRSYTDKIVKIQ